MIAQIRNVLPHHDNSKRNEQSMITMAEPSQLPLANKVALITGATRGIGLAITQHLSSLGAKVVINYASSSASANKLVEEIGSEKSLAVQADVSNVEALEKMVKQVVQQWGKIDILVLNAGVLPMMDLASTDEETFDRTMAVNVKGPYFLAQVFLALFGIRRWIVSSFPIIFPP